MKELQKDVAEALYWLSTLIITVTALHSSTSLILRSLSKAGVPSVEPLSAKRRDRALKGLIARMTDLEGEEYVGVQQLLSYGRTVLRIGRRRQTGR